MHNHPHRDEPPFWPTAVVAVITIALIALLDSGGSAQSHIGRSLSVGGITGIALRKAALNGYLLLHSKWSLCLIAATAGIRILRLSGTPRVASPALITGTVALLLLNDSGVVAAANALLIGFAVLLMAEKNDPDRAKMHAG